MIPDIIKDKLDDVAWSEIRATYPDMVKFAVDIANGWLSLGCELHVDCYEKLLAAGSAPADLWGANLYPADGRVDYISLVNIRPPANRSMKIEDPEVCAKIDNVVRKLLPANG